MVNIFYTYIVPPPLSLPLLLFPILSLPSTQGMVTWFLPFLNLKQHINREHEEDG